MARTNQLSKSVTEATPVLAVVGAADVTVERVRAVAKSATVLSGEIEARVAKAQAEAEATFAKMAEVIEARVAQAQSAVEARRQKVQSSVEAFDAKAFADQAQQVPALAVSRALELAGKVEKGYEDLAERGKKLVDRLAAQQATQDLLSQGKVTLSRTKAAVTTARKAVDTTAAAALAAVSIGAKEAADAVAASEKVVEGALADTEKVVAGAVAETEKVVAGAVAETEKVFEDAVLVTEEAAKAAGETARKRAVATRRAVKTVGTTARKTATAAKKAAESGADKIGN